MVCLAALYLVAFGPAVIELYISNYNISIALLSVGTCIVSMSACLFLAPTQSLTAGLTSAQTDLRISISSVCACVRACARARACVFVCMCV